MSTEHNMNPWIYDLIGKRTPEAVGDILHEDGRDYDIGNSPNESVVHLRIKQSLPLSIRLINEVDGQLCKLEKMILSFRDRLHPVLIPQKSVMSEECPPSDKNPESPIVESLRATKEKVQDIQALVGKITSCLNL